MLSTLTAKLIALVVTATLVGFTADQLSALPGQGEQIVALNSIQNVANTAQDNYLLNPGTDWTTTLDLAASQAQSQGSTSAVGDLVTWTDTSSCYSATIAYAGADVTVNPC